MEDLKQKRYVVFWILVAVFFALLTSVLEVSALVCYMLDRPETKAFVISAIGTLILSCYCYWIVDSSKPESWKK